MKSLVSMICKAIQRFWSVALGICEIVVVIGKPSFLDITNTRIIILFLLFIFIFGCIFGWSEGRRTNDRDALALREVEVAREKKQAELENQRMESSIRSDIESMSFDGKVLLACLSRYGHMDFKKGCKPAMEKLLNGSSLFVKVVPISPDQDRLMLTDVGKEEVERNKDLLKDAYDFDPEKYRGEYLK